MGRRILRRLIWVYTVCRSSDNFWTQRRVVNCTGSNFRTFVVGGWGVRMLGVSAVLQLRLIYMRKAGTNRVHINKNALIILENQS